MCQSFGAKMSSSSWKCLSRFHFYFFGVCCAWCCVSFVASNKALMYIRYVMTNLSVFRVFMLFLNFVVMLKIKVWFDFMIAIVFIFFLHIHDTHFNTCDIESVTNTSKCYMLNANQKWFCCCCWCSAYLCAWCRFEEKKVWKQK